MAQYVYCPQKNKLAPNPIRLHHIPTEETQNFGDPACYQNNTQPYWQKQIKINSLATPGYPTKKIHPLVHDHYWRAPAEHQLQVVLDLIFRSFFSDEADKNIWENLGKTWKIY